MDRKQWIYYGILLVTEAGLIGLLVFVNILLSNQIESVRRDVAIESLTLEANLEKAVDQGVLQAELDRRSHDIERLRVMIPDQDGIGDVIGAMERGAQSRGLAIQIPKIESKEAVIKPGQPVKPQAGLQEVKITVVVDGGEKEVIGFWHEIENMSYLTGVIGFDLQAERTRSSSSSSPVNPTAQAPSVGATVIPPKEARLMLEVLLSIKGKV